MSTAALTNDHTTPEGASPATAKMGMIIFLVSEAMLFAGLIAGYIVLRGTMGGEWPPAEVPEGANIGLQFPPTFMNWVMIVNSIILISSSFTLHFSEVQVAKHGKSGLALLGLTIILGTIFLCVQGWEWYHLKHEGMWFPTSSDDHHSYSLYGVYGTTFFVTTGFHGFHVLVGILLLIWCFLKQLFTRCYTPARHVSLNNVSLYWHFVDVVWIFVYVVLYVV
ncbi:MAG: heme-copper oxidase subunit III [Chthoniobacterales bacterium]